MLRDWMVDAAICAGMEIGAPRISLNGLWELHTLLAEHGFRRSSSDGTHVDPEEQNGSVPTRVVGNWMIGSGLSKKGAAR